MAKVEEQKFTIKLSILLRDSDEAPNNIMPDEQLAELIEAIQALVGDKVLIEVE